jgi:hypothetical protein
MDDVVQKFTREWASGYFCPKEFEFLDILVALVAEELGLTIGQDVLNFVDEALGNLLMPILFHRRQERVTHLQDCTLRYRYILQPVSN